MAVQLQLKLAYAYCVLCAPGMARLSRNIDRKAARLYEHPDPRLLAPRQRLTGCPFHRNTYPTSIIRSNTQ